MDVVMAPGARGELSAFCTSLFTDMSLPAILLPWSKGGSRGILGSFRGMPHFIKMGNV